MFFKSTLCIGAIVSVSCFANPEKVIPPTPAAVSTPAKVTPVSEPAATASPSKKEFDPKNPCAHVEQDKAPSGVEAEAKLQKLSDELLPIVEKTRMVKAGKPVKMAWTSHIEVCQYATAELETQTPAEEMIGQEATSKAWKLVPDELNLKATVLALLTEQAAGFYDPRKKILYVANWLPDFIKKPTLAHEMYHGIQDQTIDMVGTMFNAKNDDTKSSRSALFEGDGTLVMMLASIPGGEIKGILPKLSIMTKMVRSQSKSASVAMPVFASSPKSLQESLLFPYISGLEFVVYGVTKSGDFSLLDAAYQKLPVSSEQILHPEKYFDALDTPSEIALPTTLKLPAGWRQVYENTAGEFTLRVAFGNGDSINKESEAALGWDGDTFRTYINGKNQYALAVVLAWDDEASAEIAKTAFQTRYPDGFASRDQKTIFFVRGFGAENGAMARQLFASKITWR
jgi:hypothetical protein